MAAEARSVVVRLTAETAQYIAAMQSAGTMSANAMKPAEAAVMRQSKALDTLGRTAGVAGIAAAGALAFAAKAAMDWESQWAGVAKTVDGTSAQLAALEDDLRGLARTMPATHQEIAATAEAAGQLGVATEDITDFTRVMVMMGEATNLTADDAATSIAQFMNVMQTAAGDVDEIGNTIVDLGNKGASTEAQITDMAQRVAGAGTTIGATEADVLGLSAAMANLGIQSELGGGAVQRVLLGINTNVKSGSDVIEQYADVAGTSAQEFATAWSTDPIRAFDMLVQGLGRIQNEGGDVASVLEEMGIKGTQNLQVMLRLAGSGDMLSKSLDQSSVAWEQNTALLEEYTKRAGTTEAQVQVAWNNIKDAGIDAGESLLPVVAGAADSLAGLANAYQAIPGPAKGAINGLLGTTAVLGLGIWGATKAISTVRDIKGALDALPLTADKSSRALRGLGAAAGGLVALGAVAGAIRAIQDATDETLPGVDSLALQLLELKNGELSALGGEFDSLGESIRRMTDKTTEEKFGDFMQTPFKGLVGEGGSLREARAEIDQIDQALASLVQNGGPDVAADAFAALGEAAGLSRSQLFELEGLLPGYQEAVSAAAAADLLAADAAGEHSGAVKSGADALEQFLGPADSAAGAAENVGKQLAIAAMSAEDMESAFASLNGVLDISSSLVAYEGAIDALTASLGESGSFNAGVEAGRTNIENMNAVVSTAIDRAEALKSAGDNLAAMRVLRRAVSDLEEFGGKSEGAKKHAADLIDELDNVLNQLGIEIDPDPALGAIDDVGGALEGLDGKKARPRVDPDTGRANDKLNATERLMAELSGTTARPTVDPDTRPAMNAIAAVKVALKNIPDEEVLIRASYIYKRGAIDAATGSADGTTVPRTGRGYADRHLYMLADGEEVISNRHGQADKNRAALKAANAGARIAVVGRAADGATIGAYGRYAAVPGLADGGTARSLDDRIEIVGLLQQIRDLRHDLAKDGKGALDGLRRRAAELDLQRAERDLRRAKNADEREARQEAREKARDEREKAREQQQTRQELRGSIGGLFDAIFPPDELSSLEQVNGAIADFRTEWLDAGGTWTHEMREWAQGIRASAAQYDRNAAAIEAETARRDQLSQTLDDQQSQLNSLNSTMASFNDTVAGNFLSDPFNRTISKAGAAGPASAALAAAQADLSAAQAAGDAARASRLYQQIALLQGQAAAETGPTDLTGIAALREVLTTDRQNAEAFTAALQTLADKGLDTTGDLGGLYADLAAKGDLVTAQELAALSAEQIDEYEKLFKAREDAAATVGALATQEVYGAQHDELVAAIAKTTGVLDQVNTILVLLEATQSVLGEQVRQGAAAGVDKLDPRLVTLHEDLVALPRELRGLIRQAGGR